jgi:hypothetical protein
VLELLRVADRAERLNEPVGDVQRHGDELVDRLTSLSEVEASITSARFGASPRRRLDHLRHLRPSA